MSAPPTVRTVAELRGRVAEWRSAGERVALVPTMGALHAGHITLLDVARVHADRVVASIFVNPTQFAPHEDFDRYPRDEATDADKLAAGACDLLYAPAAAEMYPEGDATRVTVSAVSEPLEGAFRPHFFAGVATVVAKLLIQAQADVAVFGEKDYQQLLVIRRMVRDLAIPTQIVGGPIVREPDGLALSSRNAYLSPAERATAVTLNAALRALAQDARSGRPLDEAETAARDALLAAGFGPVDYVEVRRADDLARFDGAGDGPCRALGAAWLGRTRLIDNVAV